MLRTKFSVALSVSLEISCAQDFSNPAAASPHGPVTLVLFLSHVPCWMHSPSSVPGLVFTSLSCLSCRSSQHGFPHQGVSQGNNIFLPVEDLLPNKELWIYYRFTPESAASATQTHQGSKENSFQVSAAWKTPHFHGIYENPSREGDPRVSHCVMVQRGRLLSQEVARRWQCLEGQCGLGTAWSSGSGALYQLISQTFTNSN